MSGKNPRTCVKKRVTKGAMVAVVPRGPIGCYTPRLRNGIIAQHRRHKCGFLNPHHPLLQTSRIRNPDLAGPVVRDVAVATFGRNWLILEFIPQLLIQLWELLLFQEILLLQVTFLMKNLVKSQSSKMI